MAILSIYAALTFTRAISNTLSHNGAIDFHAYWYAGHFVRQGTDPYWAYLNSAEPNVPIHYVDKVEAAGQPVSQGLCITPANSAPMVLLLHLLAYFSWPVAKMLWLALNAAMVLATPWLLWKLLPCSLDRWWRGLIALTYYGMAGTRVALGNGQTSIIVIFLMLASLVLLQQDRKYPAGIALGLALSKFTLAIPLFLFLAYKRKWLVLGVSILVQVLGLAVMAALPPGTPMSAISDYYSIAAGHVYVPGIHLTGLFPTHKLLPLIVGIGFSILVLAPMSYILFMDQNLAQRQKDVTDYLALTALCLWGLLAAYHQIYDGGLAILAVAMAIGVLLAGDQWSAHPVPRIPLLALLLVGAVALSLPGMFFGQFLAWWDPFIRGATTVVLLAFLAAALLLLKWSLPARPRAGSAPQAAKA